MKLQNKFSFRASKLPSVTLFPLQGIENCKALKQNKNDEGFQRTHCKNKENKLSNWSLLSR